jgi:hypothetical protein
MTAHKLNTLPIRAAVPAGAYVLISEPSEPGSPLSLFAKLTPGALGGGGSGGVQG